MWELNTTNQDDLPYIELMSPSILVHVYNKNSFPDWVNECREDLALINAVSDQTNVNWQIDIYGDSLAYVGSFTGYSSDGNINLSWNLMDNQGHQRADSQFYSVTKVTPAAINSPTITTTNPVIIKVIDNYPDQGQWAVARADFIPHTLQNYNLFASTEDGFSQMGESAGGVLPGTPFRNSGHAMFCYNDTNSHALLTVFTNSTVRNFYFVGHGGPDWIGVFPDMNGNFVYKINASQVASKLNTLVSSTNSIRYRWVWLDCCNAALGVWPQTFGLGTHENVALDHYASRPGAFYAFTTDIYYAIGHRANSVDIGFINYRGYFLDFWWLLDNPLMNSFDEATFFSGSNDSQYLKVYGYWGLHWDELNTKGEWP